MTKFFRNNLLYIIGGAIGATGGYLYYFYIGCESGTCLITSSPVMSVLCGAAIGGLLLGMLKRNR